MEKSGNIRNSLRKFGNGSVSGISNSLSFRMGVFLPNNPKNLDLSYKMNLDFGVVDGSRFLFWMVESCRKNYTRQKGVKNLVKPV